MAGTLQQRINQLALAASVFLFAAIGVLWWRDRTHAWDTPRFDPARFATVAAAGPAAAGRTRFLVAVHPGCSHCRERLAELTRAAAADSSGAALAALLVDVEPRPAGVDLGVPLPGGVWWDSAGIWRNRWGRRVYGETFVFTHSGALERVIPTRGDWRDVSRR
ncbi:MAG: hypothetical protein HZA61_03250 [Candidatus Eisenbacteria bacterium]|uniref:Uncharacterized protein n=1 Tax=Eiseniibacteriota bacterium TaxID=2212470 RepID=A0A933SA18_UNCEI|nr:hypothetical protein [Candidatus Eisenbacteria bacterium]